MVLSMAAPPSSQRPVGGAEQVAEAHQSARAATVIATRPALPLMAAPRRRHCSRPSRRPPNTSRTGGGRPDQQGDPQYQDQRPVTARGPEGRSGVDRGHRLGRRHPGGAGRADPRYPEDPVGGWPSTPKRSARVTVPAAGG